MDCETGCGREAKEGALCYACARAKRRNGTVVRKSPAHGIRYPPTNRREMVLEACRAVSEVDALNDAAWNRAWTRLWTAVARYRRGANTVRKRPETLSRG